MCFHMNVCMFAFEINSNVQIGAYSIEFNGIHSITSVLYIIIFESEKSPTTGNVIEWIYVDIAENSMSFSYHPFFLCLVFKKIFNSHR